MTDGMRKNPPKLWYCISCLPGMDVRFAADLGSRGYEVLIAITYERQKAGNRVWIEPEMYLAPYVWVCVDQSAGQDFNTVKQTFGFNSAVSLRRTSNGMEASIIPECVIFSLKLGALKDLDASMRRVRKKDSLYAEGEEVITHPDHPLTGYKGVITGFRNGDVIVDFGQLRVRLSEADIAPARAFQKRERRKVSA